MKKILLGIGSNKNYKELSSLEILQNACLEISSMLSCVEFSSVYKTKAMYVQNQSDFYNMVAFGNVEDDVSPYDFLDKLNDIEKKYGRNRSQEIRFGPRSLDLDIELWGKDRISSERLTIPHERLYERGFVLIPCVEVLQNSADEFLKSEFSGDFLEALDKLQDFSVEKLITFKDLNSLKFH